MKDKVRNILRQDWNVIYSFAHNKICKCAYRVRRHRLTICYVAKRFRKMRRPLVAITPKSLLRHPLAVSSLEELTEGEFQNVIGEIDSNIAAKKVKRVVMCSGKVYYDLLEQRRQNEQTDIAIIRIEQLYPFPYEDMKKVLEPYAT
ncbi:2-oxoglutarate dehydrogenase E1 component [Actinobacillus pleuropneumoniae]|nr:2-oxoglutarate dehydrogenase E1 component [Actinobacillus pleuropneumoniae]